MTKFNDTEVRCKYVTIFKFIKTSEKRKAVSTTGYEEKVCNEEDYTVHYGASKNNKNQ